MDDQENAKGHLSSMSSPLPEHISRDGRTGLLNDLKMSELPDWMSRLTSFTTLKLNDNLLTELPHWFRHLTALTNLDLGGNSFRKLPDSLLALSSLTTLNLRGNLLTELPDTLGNLTSLTALDLSDNGLTELPDILGNLTSLTALRLNGNRLTELPDTLGNLTSLITLDLSDNHLTELPDTLGNMSSLTNLSLRKNRLAELPDTFSELTSLRILDLSRNELTHLPDTLGGLASLTALRLDYNGVIELPDSLGDLTRLADLDLTGNNLTELPHTLGNLHNLTTLRLTGNRLTELPDTFRDLTSLTSLNLSGNLLDEVPDPVGNLTGLVDVNLGYNHLTNLPDWLSALTSVAKLELRNNLLTKLPDWDNRLPALTQLGLESNGLAELPSWLAGPLSRGTMVQLNDNPLVDPLPELLARGASTLATYLASLAGALPQYEAKMLLVGEGNVGKTSLVASLQDAPFIKDRPTTHGIEISPLSFEHPGLGVKMTVRAWDFGGQDVYRITHQFFYSRRALYVLVWHAREGQEQNQVEDWLRRIRLRAGADAQAIIVATYCAERLPDLDYRQLQILFPAMLTGHFEIDNKTRQGITELRRAIAVQAARLPQMGQRVNPRWVAARDTILARADSDPQIPYDEFAAACTANWLTSPETVTLAELLHDLGHIIYYGDDDGLRDIVVLNPEWLTRAISYVLNDQQTRDAGGILDHDRLRRLWQHRDDGNGYPAQYHPYFLRLMEKFDVSYRLEDGQRSLVAQMVPHERPELPWRADTPIPTGMRRLSLICELSDQAPGLIAWLTVRHHGATTRRHWRRGVFLRHPTAAYRSEALLELQYPNELAVEVRAPSPDLYFHYLLSSMEELIAKRWPGLDYKLLIPCPGQNTGDSPCAGRFPLDGLLRLRENGHASMPCMTCGSTHEISLLLTGFATRRPLAAEIREQMTRMEHRLIRVEGLAAEATAGISETAAAVSDTAAAIRRVLRVVSTEVVDCPSLFTLAAAQPTGGKRLQIHLQHYRLTLWCQHPDHWHPWTPASYEIYPPREWFTTIAPYAALVVHTLQLLVPLTGSIAVASLPTEQIEAAAAHLDMMKTIVDDLPVLPSTHHRDSSLGQANSQLTAAEGEALRALRVLIFRLDASRRFGGLRRVQDPSGDFLWVCAHHYPDYDPGLPELP